MPSFDADTAECLVRTRRAGMLATVGHDLELRVRRFTIDAADDLSRVEARFDAGSLEVARALRDGAELVGALSERDRRAIAKTTADEVLDARRHPEILFCAREIERTTTRAEVRGELTLRGHRRPVVVAAELMGGAWRACTRLYQPDFHITPYAALLGTLKVAPEVEIVLTIPARTSASP